MSLVGHSRTFGDVGSMSAFASRKRRSTETNRIRKKESSEIIPRRRWAILYLINTQQGLGTHKSSNEKRATSRSSAINPSA
jgi:hypothetical protein